MKFELGQCVITRAAHSYAQERGLDPLSLLRRHALGDWGDLDAHDKKLNETALRTSGRIFSAYNFGGRRWYVITEADFSSTTIMLSTCY